MATLVVLGTAILLLACNSDRESGLSNNGTTPAAPSTVATGEAAPTQPSTGAIRPAAPSPTQNATTPAPFDYEAFLAQRDLMPGEPPVEADITGDGTPETLLNAHARDCASCRVRTFFVISGNDVLFEDGGAGWLTPLDNAEGFQWFSPLLIPGEPLCCPSWFGVETYRWDGASFALHQTVDLQHFQEVNNLPITEPLSPPVQLATVVLHYVQIDRGHYAQAHAVLSDGFRANNAFDAWAAGFSSTQSVQIESVSIGSGAAEVNVRLVATDNEGGASTTTVYEGEWTLVEESGAWKLDSASIAVVGP